MEQDIATQVVGLGGATDFSLWKLFLRADFVVKFVIILLIACSIFSWALIFDKFKLFKNINSSINDFEKKFWKAKSAESFNNSLPANSKDPAILIFKSAMTELIKTKRQSSAVQAARVGRILEIATDTESVKFEAPLEEGTLDLSAKLILKSGKKIGAPYLYISKIQP